MSERFCFCILIANFNLSDRFTNIDWHRLTLYPEALFRYTTESTFLTMDRNPTECYQNLKLQIKNLTRSLSRFQIYFYNGLINTRLICFLGKKIVITD